MADQEIDTPVLIAGGGPVGMLTALTLAHFGIRSVVVEQNATTTRHPKMDLTNGRSMELFRRLGIVDVIRAAGVPENHSLDIVWASHGLAGVGNELWRFSYPTPAEQKHLNREQNNATTTLEPMMRVSQAVLEPVLKRFVDENPLCEIRHNCELVDFQQNETVVKSIIETRAKEKIEFSSDYLIGCDGGNSLVRRKLGIALEGNPAVAVFYMIHIRSTALDVLQPKGEWFHWQTAGGSMIAQNDKDLWTLHLPLPPPHTDGSTVDPHRLMRDWAGRDFDFEVLIANSWTPRLVVAETLREGRVFLAGDAAHQVIPSGGYGMNTGVADAMDLGWKLAAFILGWAGDKILDSYEKERLPIAIRNRAASARHMQVRIQIMSEILTKLKCDGSDDPVVVAQVGEAVGSLGNAENESTGIEFGYIYHGSPLVATESGESPADDPLHYYPTTWPGARLPSFFLPDGTALYDRLGKWFTLIALPGTDVNSLLQAAEKANMPLDVLRIEECQITNLLEQRLILVRPDQHVAWRGDDCPADSDALIRLVIGKPDEAVARQ